VFILKVVKVLCFDTLLQVLTLKVDTEVRGWRLEVGRTPKVPPPQVSSKGIGGCHTPAFGKRGCKLLKTKDGSRKTKGKKLQAVERARLRVGGAGGVSEVSLR
jgi:hypothetical protein